MADDEGVKGRLQAVLIDRALAGNAVKGVGGGGGHRGRR